MKVTRRFVVHPFLFAVYPVLFLWAHNLDEVWSAREPLFLMAVSGAFAVSFLGVMAMAFRDPAKAGVAVSAFLFLFFSYGHLSAALCPKVVRLPGCEVPRDALLFPLWMVLMGAAIVSVARSKADLRGVTLMLNAAALGLTGLSAVRIGGYCLENRGVRPEAAATDSLGIVANAAPDTLRDIYYIVLDRYGSAATLEEVFGFDNSDFLDSLTGRGFYIASESRSNYLKTFLSLASTLNLEYLDHLSTVPGEDSDDKRPVYKMLRSYRVWRFLKAHGYRFLHFGSWWEPTRENPHADRNYNAPRTLPEFSMALYRSTLAYPMGSAMADSAGGTDFRRLQWERVRYKFDELAAVAAIDEPTFVFAHMLIPHDPFVFDSAGNFLSREERDRRGRRRCYVEQLIYANRRIIGLVDRLQCTPGPRPIVIIQADEGPYPEEYKRLEWRFDWRKATREQLREKTGILNAYYLPGVETGRLYPEISPVNTFRLVFDLYFSTHLDLLPDHCYAFVDDLHPYRFFEVTETVRGERGAAK